MRVFKFGGASVNSAAAVQNMASIIRRHYGDPMVVVISAMGKTTNKLEKMVPGVSTAGEQEQYYNELVDYHLQIANELIPEPEHKLFTILSALFGQLREKISLPPTDYNFDYDQVVSFGELISTTIISHYLNTIGIQNEWIDVRKIITTDTNYREGRVDWTRSQQNAQFLPKIPLVITQGFIAGTLEGTTTTLGREGSDYSAAILSYCLDAESMTIWKDVPGFLNADPKFFKDTIKIQQIPYNEAIELAYYGASVIHPKTVKPIQKKKIKQLKKQKKRKKN